MRQRNPFPYSVEVPAIPAEVGPGEVVDWPDRIAGFEPADIPEPPASGPVEGPGKDAGPSKPPRKPGRSPAATDEEPAP